jgi:arylsulfatase A-like enzyme
MKNRNRVTSLIIISCALYFPFSTIQAKKNVLFLMSDDFNCMLRASGNNNQAYTPNLDKLAKKGVLFTKAYSAAPLCSPSRNAILSGYRPRTTGVVSNSGFIRDQVGFENVVTLHQYFKENGYYAAGAGKIWHRFRMAKEFPMVDPTNWTEVIETGNGCSSPNFPFSYSWDAGTTSAFNLSYKKLTVDPKDCGGYKAAQEIVKRLNGYSSSQYKDQPFFLAFGEYAPHIPWDIPEFFWNKWKTEDIQLPAGYNPDVWPSLGVTPHVNHLSVVANNKHKEVVHGYLAAMAYADSSIGIIIDALEASPYKDNTIVVFCGDHGFHLGEKGHYQKMKQWEQSNNTTLIIYDPGAAGNGKTSTKLVSLQDIYPTLVELAGLPRKDNIEGQSLAPLLDAPDHPNWNNPILMSIGTDDWLKTQEWSYLPDNNGKKYLFNRTTDPYEWKNVWDENPDVVAKLQKQMDSIIAIGTQFKSKILANVTFKKTNHVIPGIIEAEDYDDGAEGQDFHDLDSANTGSLYRTDGVDIKATSDGSGFEVMNTGVGEWLAYTIPEFTRGTYSLTARVNAGGKAGKLAVYIDNHFIGEIQISNSAGWQNIELGKVSAIGVGYKKLKVVVTGGNPSINYFTFGNVTTIGKFEIGYKGQPRILKDKSVVDGKLRLDLHSMDAQVELKIFNPEGKVLIEEVIPGEIDLTYDLKGKLPPGQYILQLEDWDSSKKREVFVVGIQ